MINMHCKQNSRGEEGIPPVVDIMLLGRYEPVPDQYEIIERELSHGTVFRLAFRCLRSLSCSEQRVTTSDLIINST